MSDEARRKVREDLENWDGEYPPSVRLTPDIEPGEIETAADDVAYEYEASLVTGEIVRFAEGRSQEYGEYLIVVIHEDALDEEISIHAFHEVLISSLAEESAEPGEGIAIRRLEDREVSGTDRTYANYEVRFPDRGDDSGAPDFSKYLRRDTKMVEEAKREE